MVLTNFKELRLYNSYTRKPVDGLRIKLVYHQYLPKFDELWILSRESVVNGSLNMLEAKKERKIIDEEILSDLLLLRQKLTDNISKNNSLNAEQIKESVQKIIDRLIVIRAAEDRGILGFESLYKDFDAWKNRGLSTPFMRNLKGLFLDFDEVYNTKLFARHESEDYHIGNDLFEEIIYILYKYNFDLISTDVLGSIYEDYLGHILQNSKSGNNFVESKKKRKEEGIYYTPIHVVEYVVRNTLGKILGEHKDDPEKIQKIKVLDPSCGSGSFTIKCFDIVKEWYDNYNNKRSNSETLTAHLERIFDVGNDILNNNIFGVDLDPQAAEIASVNMMLKSIRKDEVAADFRS